MNNATATAMNAQLTCATDNDLDVLESARQNIQNLVDQGRISQREACQRSMSLAFSLGVKRGSQL